jgi:hypothetical protein
MYTKDDPRRRKVGEEWKFDEDAGRKSWLYKLCGRTVFD